MYGLGIVKGLGVTMKNLVLPSRQFNIYQYPDKKASPIDLAKSANRNPIMFIVSNPIKAIRSLIGLETMKERIPQNPRFRGQEFAWFEQRCTGCASCAKYCPLGIIKIVTDTSGVNQQEGQSYDIEVFDIDVNRLKKAEKKPSTWFRPQLTNQNYDPMSGDSATSQQVGRHQKPSKEDQKGQWVNR
jgi:ferredoxin